MHEHANDRGWASGASTGTTAFTCVNEALFVGANKFTEEHCKTANNTMVTCGHRTIIGEEKITLKLTRLMNPTFAARIFRAPVILEGTGVECVGCTAEDK